MPYSIKHKWPENYSYFLERKKSSVNVQSLLDTGIALDIKQKVSNEATRWRIPWNLNVHSKVNHTYIKVATNQKMMLYYLAFTNINHGDNAKEWHKFQEDDIYYPRSNNKVASRCHSRRMETCICRKYNDLELKTKWRPGEEKNYLKWSTNESLGNERSWLNKIH